MITRLSAAISVTVTLSSACSAVGVPDSSSGRGAGSGGKADRDDPVVATAESCGDLVATMDECLGEHAEGCLDIYASEISACCGAFAGRYYYCDRLAERSDCEAQSTKLRECVVYGLENGEEIGECLDYIEEPELAASCCDTGAYLGYCHFVDHLYQWVAAAPAATQPEVDVNGGEGGRVGVLAVELLGVSVTDVLDGDEGPASALSHVARAGQEAFGNDFCDYRFAYPSWTEQSSYALLNWLREIAVTSTAEDRDEQVAFDGFMVDEDITALADYLRANGGIDSYRAFYSRDSYHAETGCDVAAEVSINLLWNPETNQVVFIELFKDFLH